MLVEIDGFEGSISAIVFGFKEVPKAEKRSLGILAVAKTSDTEARVAANLKPTFTIIGG